jgi:hypothetical protein
MNCTNSHTDYFEALSTKPESQEDEQELEIESEGMMVASGDVH